ncbi:MAG: bifunctional pyr operon transcriptional regulator/uracil phosphoribosyltransferase PyrR [Arenicellales bacterium]|jgi:pyrimidine operon attenuation protein/uracil phosphoribosyltransferase|nr:bifunctional pyr operon transcriptional regulator/uracil phosphoribosyltransferase PyrR [Arenicellales bacterium]MDP7220293.1 bifunctional pyr operon transcriptional regulator/uracil phosphoribosyltransferase PyrR [Arenicellales bacterium]|tara:strand:- start:1165 stop:1659 length:495 start_codon:yes stop_codon:yes gene_type:complete
MNAPVPEPDVLIRSMADGLAALSSNDSIMIGIHTGGVWIARQLHTLLGLATPLGSININFYRDDFSRIGLHPQVSASEIPADIEGQNLILVDDVLQTGRTVRAALNEIFSYGRPDTVKLAVLVERDGRELPIQPDIVGTRMALEQRQHIKLSGPEHLRLVIAER